VKNGARRILEEHAAAGKLVDSAILDFVIVVGLALGDLLLSERHVIVEIEVAAVDDAHGKRQPMRFL
jgi:hypothetical protein